MPRNILLIEPNYKNKYPPIGLMKISTYHKELGDKVSFFKGELKDFAIELKLKNCLSKLSRIVRNYNWQQHEQEIVKYLATKRKAPLISILSHVDETYKVKVSEALKQCAITLPKDTWDRIYVSTLFTFYWDITIKTIEFTKELMTDTSNIYVGGVMATLLKEEIKATTGITPLTGLLDKPGILDAGNKLIIDELPLDYSILDEIDYKYPTNSAYFTFMTKGCTRKCAFCSVPKLEPTYKDKIETIDKFKHVNDKFGEQRNLLLMDNNVLASPRFAEIIQEIKDMGFDRSSYYNEPNQLDIAIKNLKESYNDKAYLPKAVSYILSLEEKLKGDALIEYKQLLNTYNLDKPNIKKADVIKIHREIKDYYEKARPKKKLTRYVDFNQGTDARYVTDENMRLMSEIPIRPLRIAFDNIGIKQVYINAVELAAKYGIDNLSNYILYNFHDKPEDFYERLRINVDLGKRLNIKIFSFPMKYIPLFGEEAKHRKYIGSKWNRKFIRAIQSILNATKGIVAPGFDFFEMAFGRDINEFMELLWMPETYIINRLYFINNGMVDQWRNDLNDLDELELVYAREIIKDSIFSNINELTTNPKILRLLSHYVFTKDDKAIIDKQVKKLRSKFNKLIRKDIFVDLTITHDFDSTKRQPIRYRN